MPGSYAAPAFGQLQFSGTDNHMLFHHLPPVSLIPQELSSCASGLVRALALWEEAVKMLQKGAVGPVDQPGPGYYSRLFLVEKETGSWRPVINLLALNGFITLLMKFKMETVPSVLTQFARETECSPLTQRMGISRFRSIRGLDHIFGSVSRDVFISSGRYASVFPWLCKRSPESSLWFRSGRIGGA